MRGASCTEKNYTQFTWDSLIHLLICLDGEEKKGLVNQCTSHSKRDSRLCNLQTEEQECTYVVGMSANI